MAQGANKIRSRRAGSRRLRARLEQLDQVIQQKTFLADLWQQLVGSLDYDETLRNIADLLVPRLADMCTLHMFNSEGEGRLVVAKHADPARLSLIFSLQEHQFFREARGRVMEAALRTGRPQICAAMPTEIPERSPEEPEQQILTNQLNLRSFVLMLLVSHEHHLGVLVLGCAESGRSFDPGDEQFFHELATIVAIALDNARLFQAAQNELCERKQAEEALRASEERYRSLIESQNEIIVRMLPDGTRTFVNDAYCRYLGRSREELIGSNLFENLHPDDYARVAARRDLYLAGQKFLMPGESRIIRVDGSIAWCEWTGRGIYDAAGQLVEIQSVGRDITARKEAEERRGWLTAILEAAPDVVGYMTLDGRVEYVNRAGRELFGFDDGNPDMFTWFRSRPQPEGSILLIRQQAIPTALREGAWTGEVLFCNRNGYEIPYLFTALALRDSMGKIARLAVIARDVSELRRAEVNRMALDRKLLEAQKLESLGILAGGLAHDFNNILTVILGYAELALIDPYIQEDTRSSINKVIIGAQSAAELTRAILAYAGKGKVMIVPVSWNDLVRDMSNLIMSLIPKGCRLEQHLAYELPLVDADIAQLRQVLLNLLVNAGEAIDGPGGKIRVETTVENLSQTDLDQLDFGADLPAGAYVRLTVSDTGRGMDEATLEHIFDPFFTTKFTGRGLGLAAVQGIVRGHYGALRVLSTIGVGTSFSIWLPISQVHRQADPVRRSPDDQLYGELLLIDDEPAVREIAVRLLRRLGLTVHSAPDGQSGINMLREGLPGVVGVLVDMTMPHMSGDEVAHVIQQIRPGIPVVLMSGYSADDLAVRQVAQGVQGFLQKPFTVESLRTVLEPLLVLTRDE